MNLFYLDATPETAARYHCDKHVVKMILETAQLLSSAWHYLKPEQAANMPIYLPTHINHPSTRWCRHSYSTYSWAWRLGKELCKEYTYRYGRRHKTEDIMDGLGYIPFPANDTTPWVEPFQAMPNEYMNESSLIAYRTYYIYGKTDLLVYTKRNAPDWLDGLAIEKK